MWQVRSKSLTIMYLKGEKHRHLLRKIGCALALMHTESLSMFVGYPFFLLLQQFLPTGFFLKYTPLTSLMEKVVNKNSLSE